MNRKPPPAPSGTASKIGKGTASKVAAARRAGQDAAREANSAPVAPDEKLAILAAARAFLDRPETGTAANLAQRAGIDGSNLAKALSGKRAMSDAMAAALRSTLADIGATPAPRTGPSDADISTALAALKAELEHPAMAAAILGDLPAPPPDFAAMNRTDLIAAMRAEAAAIKAWETAPEGPRPATPALDWHNTGGKAAPRTRAARTAAPTPAGPRFEINGRPVADAHNRLGGITRASGLKGGVRLPTAEVRALLAAAGIADPDTTEWTYTLPNGVTIGARIHSAAAAA